MAHKGTQHDTQHEAADQFRGEDGLGGIARKSNGEAGAVAAHEGNKEAAQPDEAGRVYETG